MLKEKLQNGLKESLKSGDVLKRLVLGMLLTAIKNKEFNKRTKLSKTEKDISRLETASLLNDEETIEIVGSEVKKRKEAIESYEKGSRPELAQKEKKELEILMTYMPEQMSEEDVRKLVRQTITEMTSSVRGRMSTESESSADHAFQAGRTSSGIKDTGLPAQAGKVIGQVMAKVKGRTEGDIVSKLVKEELSK